MPDLSMLNILLGRMSLFAVISSRRIKNLVIYSLLNPDALESEVGYGIQTSSSGCRFRKPYNQSFPAISFLLQNRVAILLTLAT